MADYFPRYYHFGRSILSEDRNLTVGFEKVYQIFQNGKLLNQVHEALSLVH